MKKMKNMKIWKKKRMILKYIFMYYLTFLKDDDSEHEDMDEDEIEEEEVKDTFFNSGILYCNL
jgi:hypothetical protein